MRQTVIFVSSKFAENESVTLNLLLNKDYKNKTYFMLLVKQSCNTGARTT